MPERKLAEQLERLPLNRFLRSEVLAGAETLSDEQARRKAAELKTSLDRLPGLLEQLRGDRQEVRSASVQKAEPLSIAASGRESEPLRPKQREVTMKELLAAGAHLGRQTRSWNPKMKPYIFGKRNGIHIIDLQQTVRLFNQASEFVQMLAAKGKHILFVGSKRQAREVIAEEARRCGEFYITQTWLNGVLTNFETVRTSIDRLKEIEARLGDENSSLTKKERLRLERLREKMTRNFEGIREMEKLPDALFVIDPRKESKAVSEANRLGIPVIAIASTNCDPELIDYLIPSNNDAVQAIDLFAVGIADAYIRGMATDSAWAFALPGALSLDKKPVAEPQPLKQ